MHVDWTIGNLVSTRKTPAGAEPENPPKTHPRPTRMLKKTGGKPPLAIDEHLKTWEKPVNAHGHLLRLSEMSGISSVCKVIQSALELMLEVR